MSDIKSLQSLDKSRVYIARKVHELRKERRWTQAELCRPLHLSQSRLSEIERGDGSFTAEQFLTILKLFNVAASDFAPESLGQGSDLQNALARLGAFQLQESTSVLPSERLSNVGDVVREAIVASEFPRLITALGPVVIRNIDNINLKRLHLQLTETGLERRLAWLVENTLEAIRREIPGLSSVPWRRLYSRVLGAEAQPSAAPDVLDAAIRSKRTLDEVAASSSPISRRWGIITTLQPEDFVEALRGARAARR
jgi:transcriptional regulator with XRE-family HTH domain